MTLENPKLLDQVGADYVAWSWMLDGYLAQLRIFVVTSYCDLDNIGFGALDK